MDGAVRCLRAAVRADESSACAIVLADDPSISYGDVGWETFAELTRRGCVATARGKSHARDSILVAGHRAAARYRPHPSPDANPADLEAFHPFVIDVHSDPYGWVGETTRGAARRTRRRGGASARGREARDAAPTAENDVDGERVRVWRRRSHETSDETRLDRIYASPRI